jgi:platelet-activating factor acetylhydrolase
MLHLKNKSLISNLFIKLLSSSIIANNSQNFFLFFSKKISKKTMPKTLLKPTGSYLVGHIDMEFTNPNGIDENSTILTRVFYPSNLENSSSNLQLTEKNFDTWIPSMSYFGGYGKSFRLPPFISIPGMRLLVGDLRLNSSYGLPILDNQNLPVVIFSHGLWGNRTTYSILCTEFASRGWIVFSVEHHDGSASHSFVKGVPFDHIRFEKNQNEFEVRNKQLEHRTGECLGLVEILKKLNSGEPVVNFLNDLSHQENIKQIPSDFLKSKLNFDCAIIVGHSFGGATAIRASQFTDLFKCAIAYDPWIVPIEESLLEAPKRSIPTLISNSPDFHKQKSTELIINYLKLMDSANQTANDNTAKRFISYKIKDIKHDYYSDIPSVLPKMPFSSLPEHYRVIKIILQSTFEFLADCELVSIEESKQEKILNFNAQTYPDLMVQYPQ